MATTLKGWRYGIVWAGFLGIIGFHVYVNMIQPMMNPEPYKQLREEMMKKSTKDPAKV